MGTASKEEAKKGSKKESSKLKDSNRSSVQGLEMMFMCEEAAERLVQDALRRRAGMQAQWERCLSLRRQQHAACMRALRRPYHDPTSCRDEIEAHTSAAEEEGPREDKATEQAKGATEQAKGATEQAQGPAEPGSGQEQTNHGKQSQSQWQSQSQPGEAQAPGQQGSEDGPDNDPLDPERRVR